MKGVIFLIAKETLKKYLGDLVWQEIAKEVGIENKVFLAPNDYPDELFYKLLDVTAKKVKKSPEETQEWLGEKIVPELRRVYGLYFITHKNAKDFLKSVGGVHSTITSHLPGAKPPKFEYEEPSPDKLIMRYFSKRKLCSFMKGIIRGVGDYYRTGILIEEKKCMKKGDNYCEFELTFKQTS